MTGDNHPIHYDVEYARTKTFGRPLAHGLLISPRMDGFIFIEQGSQFKKPAFFGDRITPALTVDPVWEEDGRTYIRFVTAITNQHGETLLEGFQLYTV